MARKVVENHIRIYGTIPHPDVLKEEIVAGVGEYTRLIERQIAAATVVDADVILAARREGAAIMRERAAKVAANGCLAPPDGGSPTNAEREMCDAIAAVIRALPIDGA
jgi:hypothetical protein